MRPGTRRCASSPKTVRAEHRGESCALWSRNWSALNIAKTAVVFLSYWGTFVSHVGWTESDSLFCKSKAGLCTRRFVIIPLFLDTLQACWQTFGHIWNEQHGVVAVKNNLHHLNRIEGKLINHIMWSIVSSKKPDTRVIHWKVVSFWLGNHIASIRCPVFINHFKHTWHLIRTHYQWEGVRTRCACGEACACVIFPMVCSLGCSSLAGLLIQPEWGGEKKNVKGIWKSFLKRGHSIRIVIFFCGSPKARNERSMKRDLPQWGLI